MNLTVGQKVKLYNSIYRTQVDNGIVTKVGRTLATISWGSGEKQFRMLNGDENAPNGFRWFKTLEQAEADDRLTEAETTLRNAGLNIMSHRQCPLTNPQIEELAAIVRQMLSEKPADDPEVKP